MSNDNNDQGNILDDSGINNLPEKEKEETQEIIDEIKKEEEPEKDPADKDLDKPKEEEEPEDKPKDENPKDEDEGKDPDEGKDEADKDKKEDKKEPPRSKSKLLPNWIHEKAIREKNEEIDSLSKTIEELKSSNNDKPNEEISESDKDSLKAEIEEKFKDKDLDPEIIESIVKIAIERGGKLPAEVQDKLKVIDDIREKSEIEAEETAFNSNFEEFVVPLIKAEYGEDISKDTIDVIREKTKEIAYTEEYKQTPYGVIYKGVDDFRKFERPKAGSESGKGGMNNSDTGKETDEMDFSNVSEEDIDKMDGPTFDKFSEWQEDQEKKRS